MGHRANFVIIRDGVATAYYDQWAAMGCVYLLAGGPEEAVDVVRQMDQTDRLMDWAFAEAGYLIDFDQRKMITFGYPIDVGEDAELGQSQEVADIDAALQRGAAEFLKHIAKQWPGWLLRWDGRGVDAFTAHLRSCNISTIQSQPDTLRQRRNSPSIKPEHLDNRRRIDYFRRPSPALRCAFEFSGPPQ